MKLKGSTSTVSFIPEPNLKFLADVITVKVATFGYSLSNYLHDKVKMFKVKLIVFLSCSTYQNILDVASKIENYISVHTIKSLVLIFWKKVYFNFISFAFIIWKLHIQQQQNYNICVNCKIQIQDKY